MTISTKYKSQITTQSYSAKPSIDGVELKQLQFHNDDGGNFCELFRLSAGDTEGWSAPFEARQISMSILTPNTVKAFHLHYKQDDIWYVSPYDRLIVNLIDLREDSKTFEHQLRLVLGGGKNAQLRIPAGVAHGAANRYERDMTLLYATSNQFNPAEPDEHRLPWDSFGEQIWDLTKG